MTTTIPSDMKPVTAYIRRAEELEKDASNPDSKIIAYYCRSYAMEKGIKIKSTAAETKTFLLSLMTNLEASKKVLQIKDDAGAVICENFAQSVFSKADDEDRAGVATKDTAKTFYAAATFFDILEQFGEIDAEIQEKRRYSKWKAADILNAIKAGRQPTPGAPGEATADTDGFPGPGSSSLLPQHQAQDPFVSIPSAPTLPPMNIPPMAPFSAPPQQPQPPQYQYQYQPPASLAGYQLPPSAPSASIGGSPIVPVVATPTYTPPAPTQSYHPPPPAPAAALTPQQQQQQQLSKPLLPPPTSSSPSVPSASDYSSTTVMAGVTSVLSNISQISGGGNNSSSSLSGRGQPLSSSDPRVKDAVELCSFAIAALKHNEINLAKDRLREALRRLE